MRAVAAPDEVLAIDGLMREIELALSRSASAEESTLSDAARGVAALTTEALRRPAGERPALATQATDIAARVGARAEAAETSNSGTQESGEDAYGREARHQLRLMWCFNLTSLALTTAIPALALYMMRSALDVQAMWLTVLLVVLLAAAAAGAAWQGRECRRAGAESRRIGRQLANLDEYLAPLPKSGQYLLRSIMIQRLYPRLLDDDVLLRDEDVFPRPEQLMRSLLPWDEVMGAADSETADAVGADLASEESLRDQDDPT